MKRQTTLSIDRPHTWLDQLVAGQLDEHTREQVLAWCDADPVRWRQCAQAFLEAQVWQQAFADLWTSVAPTRNGSAVRRDQSATAAHGFLRNISRYSGWAAAALIAALAFVAGQLADGRWLGAERQLASAPAAESLEEPSPAPYLSIPVNTGLRTAGPALLQVPLRPLDAETPSVEAAVRPPDYVIQQWKRRGFELSPTRRYLTGRQPDGQSIVVPVATWQFKFVGRSLD
jgi:hypothetical protein